MGQGLMRVGLGSTPSDKGSVIAARYMADHTGKKSADGTYETRKSDNTGSFVSPDAFPSPDAEMRMQTPKPVEKAVRRQEMIVEQVVDVIDEA